MGTVTMRRFKLQWARTCGLLACSITACHDTPNSNAPPIDMTATDTNPLTTGTDPTNATSSSSSTTDPDPDSSSTGGPMNCDELQCTGHGNCEMEDGKPVCACDPGYRLDGSGENCLVDESCIQLRILDEDCRQLVDAEPAVAMFFAVDFCAGTAVVPSKLEELGLSFLVLENGVDIQENVESYATVIAKPVESYVDLVIDVSDSITQSQDLPLLIEELRTLVASLQPGADEPDVYVAVHVFARDVAEYIPFTRDLAAVDDALADIAADPAAVVFLAGNGNGTDLYDALELGIERTQRIRDLRSAVSWGGVLTTGTVVLVTDGNDTSNGMLNASLVSGTTTNVISIGISDEIDAETLQQLGRDGSFLAPTPEDWPTAFAEITQRVDEYPLRSYLLGYCSSATEGDPVVGVSLSGKNLESVTEASCSFNAALFSTDASAVCDEELFVTECDGKACGGLTACGACGDGECCSGTQCQDPGTLDSACEGQHEFCDAAGLICGALSDTCVVPAAEGEPCGEGCAPGVNRCVDDVCQPVLALGDECDVPEDCPGLNCQAPSRFAPPICLPPALIPEECGADIAACEAGAYCESTCRPRKKDGESCTDNAECRSGDCNEEGVCASGGLCYWTWDSKFPA